MSHDIEELYAHLLGPAVKGSHVRLPAMLDCIEGTDDPDLFWALFLRIWPICDDTWESQPRLLCAMRKHHAERPTATWKFQTEESRLFFTENYPNMCVFRGCSRPRMLGISWTTDYFVAEDFATGHRGIEVIDPVVARGSVMKEHVFAVLKGDRNEFEIVVDPAHVKVDKIIGPKPPG